MPALLIEHSTSDFDTWHEAFARLADRRRAAGVLGERILQPVGDPRYLLLELEFATLEGAKSFLEFLETLRPSAPLLGGHDSSSPESTPCPPGTGSRDPRLA